MRRSILPAMPRMNFILIIAAGISAAAAQPAGAQGNLRALRTAEYRSLQKRLCRGWNTWSANSVMAHVHLPDGFAMTLGVKTAGMGRTYQNSFFQANQTAGRPEKIRLGAHSDDGSYTDLTLELTASGAEVYDELLRWNRWWPTARDHGGLPSWGSDDVPQLVDGTVHNFQAALYESGLDNSPMYDGVPFNPRTNLLEISDVGLNALYVADCRALEEMAGILGREEDRRELRERGDKRAAALATLWDERSGIYLNRRTDTGEASSRLSPTNFYPLIAKAPTQEQARRMIQEHYFNPREFHGEWVMPSIARNVPGYGDQEYWRGRIWGPMNFLVYLGLRNYELPDARADLAERSARLLIKSWQSDRAIYENYNANTGGGNDVRSSDAYYHWGALLGVIELLEHER
jgi:hypothetical protein